MIYIVDDRPTLYFEGVEELATGTVDDSVWAQYCSDRNAWKIENGKFTVLKSQAALTADRLRERRRRECFSVVDRGAMWYGRLTNEQKTQLSAWYTAWLDAPETGVAPEKPDWLDISSE